VGLETPWGRGETLRKTVWARNRRENTVWRWKSTGSSAVRKPGMGAFRINISVTNIFCGAATRSPCSTNPSLCRYPFIDMLPQTVCLWSSQRHAAHIGARLKNVNHRGRVRTDTERSNMCCKTDGEGQWIGQKLWHGDMSASWTPSKAHVFSSSQSRRWRED
jgi:hypothetical protein